MPMVGIGDCTVYLEIELLDSDIDPASCDNVGPCCLGCPAYDACDHHYEEDDNA